MTAGVYAIVNTTNGMTYVGSSKNLYARIKAHVNALNAGRHRNQGLQDAWSDLGRAGFSVSVLEVVEDDDVALIAAEDRWIRATNASGIYNIKSAKTGRHSGERRQGPCQCGCKVRMAFLRRSRPPRQIPVSEKRPAAKSRAAQHEEPS